MTGERTSLWGSNKPLATRNWKAVQIPGVLATSTRAALLKGDLKQLIG